MPRQIAPAPGPALPAHSAPADPVPSRAARLCACAIAGGRVDARVPCTAWLSAKAKNDEN